MICIYSTESYDIVPEFYMTNNDFEVYFIVFDVHI